MLDWPAFGSALWAVSDQLGIRPEWQLPVLSLETGGMLDPATVNGIGCVGLNQFCPGTLEQYVSVPARQYRAWLASQQLAGPILAYWRNAMQYGPIRSATRLMVAQLGPALLATALALGDTVYAAPGGAYASNSALDTAGKGSITVQDLADAMARESARPAVRQALAVAYAMRPGEQPREPVYGDDWPAPRLSVPRAAARVPVFPVTAVVVLAGAAGYAALQRRRFA